MSKLIVQLTPTSGAVVIRINPREVVAVFNLPGLEEDMSTAVAMVHRDMNPLHHDVARALHLLAERIGKGN